MEVKSCRLNGIGKWNGRPSLCSQPYKNLKSYYGDTYECGEEANENKDAHDQFYERSKGYPYNSEDEPHHLIVSRFG